MRKLHSTPKEGKPPRAKKEEPLEEGISGKKGRFNTEEIEAILKRREELIAEGLKDNAIAGKMAEETGRSAGSVAQKIRFLSQKGKAQKNPQRQQRKGFTEEELDALIRRREELIAKRMKDRAICKTIGKETGRNPGSIWPKIKELVSAGKIQRNPCEQPQKKFTEEELDALIRRREELSGKGMTDNAISSKISEEAGVSFHAIQYNIRKLCEEGRIGKNQNTPSSYRKMSDENLVSYSKDYLKKNGIFTRKGLFDTYSGLYQTLHNRNLLDAVFSDLDAESRSKSVDIILDTLSELSQ